MEDILSIMDAIPHRYPFLLVDKILSKSEDKIVGLKNVTINEPYFEGHFPGYPIMPGVLQVEGMAQCAGCLMHSKVKDIKAKLIFFTTIDEVKFRKPIFPGDQIRYEINIMQFRRNICKFEGKVYVDNVLCSEAKMMASLVDKESINKSKS